MYRSRTTSTPAWLRGAFAVALLGLAMPALHGCSDDVGTTTVASQPESLLSPLTPMDTPEASLAAEFCPTLPGHPVVVKHNQPGPDALFNVWFWGIGSGYDLTDGYWPGWCLEDNARPNVTDPGRVTTWCSYDDALPGNLSELPLNELNYLLNHRIGTWQEVQAAIWLLTWGSAETHVPTANSYAMVEEAMAKGGDFVPGPGQYVAIILYTGDGGIGPEGYQDTIVQLMIPGEPEEPGDLGACTPGYWRTHFDRWPAPYSPSDQFDDVFGTDLFEGSYTLGDAIWARGGSTGKLARHGTAALLNAAHGDFEYAYSLEEVVEMVRAGDADPMAIANDEFDCPLGGTPADPKARQE